MGNLVVFVHGIGADNHAFWGTTIKTMMNHPTLANFEVKFWGYQTTKGPVSFWKRNLIKFGVGSRTQTLERLGEHLWSDLRQWMLDEKYTNIKILGHSMGGLVASSAIGYGLEQNENRDKNLIMTIQGVAFVATPFGGARLAGVAKSMYRIAGENIHINDLNEDSVSREKIVTRFIYEALEKRHLPLKIFRASNDTAVDSGELTRPLPNKSYASVDVLRGGHSDCIQDLALGHENLKKLLEWVNPSTVKMQPELVQEVTRSEIASPPTKNIPGPDGSYIINEPPQGWRVREMSVSSWQSEGLGINIAETDDRLTEPSTNDSNILVFDSAKKSSIIPNPGQTTINGRVAYSALETLAPTQLAILPFEHAQPPFYVDRPLEHNFMHWTGAILQAGVMTVRQLDSGEIKDSGRKYMTVEMQQEIENAVVNDRDGQDVAVSHTYTAIEGNLEDHLLVMRYAAVPGDPDVEYDMQALQNLSNSFRPLGIVDVEKKRKDATSRADDKFDVLMSDKGKEIFWAEFRILALRMQGIDLEDQNNVLHAIKVFTPFETFAKIIGLEDDELAEIWASLGSARDGDLAKFRALLEESQDQKSADQLATQD